MKTSTMIIVAAAAAAAFYAYKRGAFGGKSCCAECAGTSSPGVAAATAPSGGGGFTFLADGVRELGDLINEDLPGEDARGGSFETATRDGAFMSIRKACA